MNGKKIFVALVILAMTAAVVAGLFLAGSPEQERKRRFDQERLNDLSQISYAIDANWNQDKKLPTALKDLQAKRDVYVRSLKDPRTQESYEYTSTATSTYELCAVFETDSEQELSRAAVSRPDVEGQDFWKHPTGKKCFKLEARIDPNYAKPGVGRPPTPVYPD